MKPKVVVIIVIWNGLEDTLECLRSLLQDGYPNLEIVLVDNGSTDGSVEVIRERQFPVHLISAGSNLGFTGGNNLGLVEAQRLGARYVFLLNNDTTLEKGVIRSLVDAAEAHPSAGIVAPVMHYYNTPSDIWFAGGQLAIRNGEATHDQSLHPSRDAAPYPTAWVSGCAMLVRSVAIEHVGGLDDRFYFTWEDVDWSLRMKRAGWFLLVVPKARIFHKCAKSGEKLKNIGSYYAVRNSLLFASKHAGADYWRAMVKIIFGHLRAALRSRHGNRMHVFSTTFEGLLAHLLGRYGRRAQRHKNAGRSCPPTGESLLKIDIERVEKDAARAGKQ